MADARGGRNVPGCSSVVWRLAAASDPGWMLKPWALTGKRLRYFRGVSIRRTRTSGRSGHTHTGEIRAVPLFL